jgi:dTDP-4-dehydrorhamnose reductase
MRRDADASKDIAWLIVGGDSEIGSALLQRLSGPHGRVVSTTRKRERSGRDRLYLDLAMLSETWQLPCGLQSVCIAAAVARLAACAADPAGSAAVNVSGTIKIVEKLAASGTHVVFLSTNQVFDGSIPNVAADAPTCPVSEYGRQKAQAESALKALIARGAPVAILRLAKVLGPDMPLLKTWIDALKRGEAVRAFHDMTMAPTPMELVVEAIAKLMGDHACGVFQLTGPIDASYAEIARYLADRLDADTGLVQEVSAHSMGLPTGSTPRYTTLDSSLLREAYGLAIPDVWQAIEACMAGLPASAAAKTRVGRAP